MIKSMTGYGRAREMLNKRDITVEVRSVNNRYLDCTVKMPRMYTFAEDAIKQRVQQAVSRGKVDVFITVRSEAGDEVQVGTLVAKEADGLSSPVYSSVSGKVVGVSDIFISNGSRVPAVIIDSDGEMTVDENIAPPVIDSKEALVAAIKASGVVGLGGAGFPTYAKFTTDKKIEYLVVNGAECEPYITSDTYTMLERADEIAYAIDVLVKYLNIEKVVIGVEKNKPEAIKKMEEIAAKGSNMSVCVLPSRYPQGGEKVLVYSTTGRKIGAGMLPIDVGCVVCNCTTLATLGNFFKTGMPLVEKCVTVDGGAVKKPRNVMVPIGTSLEDLFNACGGLTVEPAKIIYGGPMMGITVLSSDAPIIKNTNAVLALNEKEAKLPKTTACIRCGACVNHCPFGISPVAILKSYKEEDFLGMKNAGALLCMECGCCSYVCPAKIPNVQNNKLAKEAIRKEAQREVK